MTNRNLLIVGLFLGSAVAFTACSSDSDSGKKGSSGDAGAAGDATGAAGDTATGVAGAAGASSEAGAAGASVAEAGAAGAASTPAPHLNPQAVIVTAAEPTAYNHLLVAGTDYSTSEIASVALDTGTVSGSVVYQDGDAVSASSAGVGFALERTNDKVHLLDGSAVKTTFDLKDLGTGSTVALANKAYVPLLGQSTVSELDLKAGTVAKRIDLSEYNVASDKDGSADIDAAVYDPTAKVAYFVLGRIDRTSYDASFHLPCTTTKALIVGIDATTDKIVDLNGADTGEGIELSLINPGSVALSASGSLVVLSNGCYDGATLKHLGVEVVDPTTGSSVVAFTPTNDDYLGDLILVSQSAALLRTSDATTYQDHWYKLDLASGTLGTELVGVPDSASYDGKDLIGVGTAGAVKRYDITAGTSTTVSATSWAGNYTVAASTALVK